MRIAAHQYDVEVRKFAARLQHAPDLAIEPWPVGDVHCHVLKKRDVQMTVVERKVQRAGRLERHLPALSRPLGQIARGIDEWLAEVDARNPAAIGRSQKARRPAKTGADIQSRHVGGDLRQPGKLCGRSEPAGMELVDGSELRRREPLIVRPMALSAVFSRSVSPVAR